MSSPSLIVRRTRLSTVGDRAFPVAASRVWNDLPQHVTAAESLPVLRMGERMGGASSSPPPDPRNWKYSFHLNEGIVILLLYRPPSVENILVQSKLRRSLSCSRSFTVTDFGTNRKPIYKFHRNNTSLHQITHRFSVIAKYRSKVKVSFLTGGGCISFFNALVRGEPLNSWLNLASENYIHQSILRWKVYFDILNRLNSSPLWHPSVTPTFKLFKMSKYIFPRQNGFQQ